MCKQDLEETRAVQIQRVLTQVFRGGTISPGLLAPHLLCMSQLTPAGTFLGGDSAGKTERPCQLREAGGRWPARAGLAFPQVPSPDCLSVL